jgi:hypothetical protein
MTNEGADTAEYLGSPAGKARRAACGSAIDGQRVELTGKLEGQLKQRVEQGFLFTLIWRPA